MTTRTTYRTQHRLFTWLWTAIDAMSARITRGALRMNAAAMPRRHRMGSWEESASFRARAIRRASERDASTH